MRQLFTLGILLFLFSRVNAAVSFTGDTLVCGSLTASFTNTSSGNVAYLWNFDDPASGASNNFVLQLPPPLGNNSQSHTFSSTGTYHVKLYVLSGVTIGSTILDSAELKVVLANTPNLFLIPNVDQILCTGSTGTFLFLTATNDPKYKYTWTPAPSSVTGPNSVVYNPTTNTTLQVLVKDTTTGCTNTKSINVIFLPCSVIAVTTFIIPTCGQFTVNFTNQSIGGHHFKWYFNDPASGSNNILTKTDTSQVSHTFSDTGTYYVSLVAFDSLEQKKDSIAKKVHIYNNSFADIINKDTSMCRGTSVNLFASGLGTFAWSPATGLNTVTGNAVKATPQVTTTYYFTADNSGCVARDSVTITIVPKADPLFNTDSLCIGEEYLFTALDNTAVTYLWDFGDGKTATGSTAAHQYDTSGVFPVKLTVGNGYCDSSFTDNMVVVPDPEPKIAVDKRKAEITKATFNFSSQSKNTAFQTWNFDDGNTSSLSSVTHTFKDTGWFMVRLKTANALGCENEDTVMIRVDNEYIYFIPSAFSPNRSGPKENETFRVYGPGPVKNFEMYVYSPWGEEVFYTTDFTKSWDGVNEKGEEAPIGGYVYVVRLKDPNGKRLYFKGLVTLIR